MNFNFTKIGFLALIISFVSCHTSIDITKRKHRKGYAVSVSKNNKKETFKPQKHEQSISENIESTEPTSGEENKIESNSQHYDIEANKNSTLFINPIKRKTEKENTEKTIVEPNKRSKKELRKLRKSSIPDDDYVDENPKPKTDVFALISMISGIASIPGWLFFPVAFILSIVAIVFGFIGLSRIKTSGDKGKGMAIAGLVIGFVNFFLILMLILLIIIIFASLM